MATNNVNADKDILFEALQKYEENIKNGITPKETLNPLWESCKGKRNVIPFYSDKKVDRHGNKNLYPEFSNFYIHSPFTLKIPCGIFKGDLVKITFSEKAIMLCKASLMEDPVTYNKILFTTTPQSAKKLGREVCQFNEELWTKHVCSIAEYVVFCKFCNVPKLAAKLLTTGKSLIAEAAPRDRNWGIGMNSKNKKVMYPSSWNGSNILGWALMNAREKIAVIK